MWANFSKTPYSWVNAFSLLKTIWVAVINAKIYQGTKDIRVPQTVTSTKPWKKNAIIPANKPIARGGRAESLTSPVGYDAEE